MIERKTLKQQTQDIVFETIDACLEEIKDPFYGYVLRDNYKQNVRFRWSEKSVVSTGGGDEWTGKLNLALYHYTPTWWQKYYCFWEYAHIRNDPVIGKFVTAQWKHLVAALTCHEMAHAVQFAQPPSHPDYQILKEGHGAGWQKIYGIMRGPIVNLDLVNSGGIIGEDKYKLTLPVAEDVTHFKLRTAVDKNGALHLVLNEFCEIHLSAGIIRHYGEPLCGTKIPGLKTVPTPEDKELHPLGCPGCIDVVKALRGDRI